MNKRDKITHALQTEGLHATLLKAVEADEHSCAEASECKQDTKRLRGIVERVVRRALEASCHYEENVKTAMSEFDAAMRNHPSHKASEVKEET